MCECIVHNMDYVQCVRVMRECTVYMACGLCSVFVNALCGMWIMCDVYNAWLWTIAATLAKSYRKSVQTKLPLLTQTRGIHRILTPCHSVLSKRLMKDSLHVFWYHAKMYKFNLLCMLRNYMNLEECLTYKRNDTERTENNSEENSSTSIKYAECKML